MYRETGVYSETRLRGKILNFASPLLSPNDFRKIKIKQLKFFLKITHISPIFSSSLSFSSNSRTGYLLKKNRKWATKLRGGGANLTILTVIFQNYRSFFLSHLFFSFPFSLSLSLSHTHTLFRSLHFPSLSIGLGVTFKIVTARLVVGSNFPNIRLYINFITYVLPG